MLNVSRSNSLKIPKKIDVVVRSVNKVDDLVASKKAISMAENKKFNESDFKLKMENYDKSIDIIDKIPSNSNDLIVITTAKKLCAYVITVTEKSPNSNVGLPLGNQSNQWFALLYLNTIDRFVKEKLRVKGYVRYMDDMILIGKDKKYLQYCKDEICKICDQKLQLKLNNKTQIGKVANGIDFLGYNHILTASGRILMKLRSSSRIRMKHHLKSIKKLYDSNLVDDNYVYIRKNAFYNHIKNTVETQKIKQNVFPK